MKERLLKYAKQYGPWVGYPVFFVFALLVFASLTFPYDALRDRIVASYNQQQRDSNGLRELQIDEMSGYWLTGVHMHGVTLTSATTEVGKPPTKLYLDDVTARYAILPALVGSSRLDFDVDAFGGSISGSYGTSGDDRSMDAKFDDVALGKITLLSGILGVPIDGKLGGTVRLKLPAGKAAKASGQVALEAKGFAVSDGKAKIQGALALPRLDLGTLVLNADAKDGSLRITKFGAGGKDADVQGEGRITLRDDFADSILDLQVRFKVNDMYRGKNDVTKSLFGAPGSNAPALFELADAKIKQSKRPDGFYGWNVRGTFARPDFMPGGGGGAPGRPAFP